MIPIDHPAWKKLVTGEKQITSKQLGVNMLLHNNQLKYKADPSSANVDKLVQHTYEYFQKYEQIFQTELQQLQS